MVVTSLCFGRFNVACISQSWPELWEKAEILSVEQERYAKVIALAIKLWQA